ncbi:MAG: murein biosynthesis integral membrane protein MurJ, partial [Candidatus Aminicenantes bacterium]|nr:murein biosynthesis integral membrane protein MurJ [Candidatus Aminicenantes bacterium]
QAFYLGTGPAADAFTIAYTIPNLLRRLTAEGAMTPAFVPVFMRVQGERSREETWRFATRAFFDLAMVVFGLVLVGILFAPGLVRVIAFGFRSDPGKEVLTLQLTRVMFPYILFASLAALAGAILNSRRRFFVPASTPVLFNVAFIAAALLAASRSAQPALVFAWGVVAGGVLQLAVQIPFLVKEGMSFRFRASFRDPDMRRVARLMVPGLFATGLYQVNFALSRMLASVLPSGSAASLYYSSRVEELALGLFSISLASVLLPTLADRASSRDDTGLKSTLTFSLKLVFIATLPAAAGLLALSRPIMEVLFKRGEFGASSAAMTSGCLVFFAAGLPFLAAVKILSTAFFSLEDTRTPVLVGFTIMAVYLGLSVILMGPLEVRGLALALSLSQLLNGLLLFGALERKVGPIPKLGFLGSFLRSAAAAAMMGVAVRLFFGAIRRGPAGSLRQAGELAVSIVLGIAIYVVLLLLLDRRDARSLRALVSRRPPEARP